MTQGRLFVPEQPPSFNVDSFLDGVLRVRAWHHVLSFAIPRNGYGWRRHLDVMQHGQRFQATPEENREFRALVSSCVAPFWRKPPIALGHPLAVCVDAADERPKAHRLSHGALRVDAPRWKTSKPDADNVLKGICDSLSGRVWADDAQVAIMLTLTRWTDPNEERRTLVHVFDLTHCDTST